MSLYNIEHEKHFLSAVIKNPLILADCPHINDKDFSDVNRQVFQMIQVCIASKGDFNKFILIDKLKAAQIKIAGTLDPEIYINSLDILNVSESAGISIAKEIKKTTVRRTIHLIGREIQALTESEENKRPVELLNEATKIFNNKINIIEGHDDEPVDLFSGAEEYIESIGNNPEPDGVISPFPIYRDIFGDLTPGDMSVFVARPKIGKSTWLMNILRLCAEMDKNNEFISLILDTELETKRVMRRAVASIAGVNEFYLRTGFWRNNAEMTRLVRDAFALVNRIFNKIHHIYVGGKTVDEQISIVRRWHKKHARGKKNVLLCLDYIKLGSADDLTGPVKDYQLVGQKVDRFKQLSTELGLHTLTAAQSNRLNEGRDLRRSDGAVVGLSDQISQFASNIYLLEKLTYDQVGLLGELEATHSLTGIYTRNQGPNAQGFDTLVKYEDASGKTRYSENFILYKFNNFSVKELIDFKELVKRNQIVAVNVANNQPITSPDVVL